MSDKLIERDKLEKVVADFNNLRRLKNYNDNEFIRQFVNKIIDEIYDKFFKLNGANYNEDNFIEKKNKGEIKLFYSNEVGNGYIVEYINKIIGNKEIVCYDKYGNQLIPFEFFNMGDLKLLNEQYFRKENIIEKTYYNDRLKVTIVKYYRNNKYVDDRAAVVFYNNEIYNKYYFKNGKVFYKECFINDERGESLDILVSKEWLNECFDFHRNKEPAFIEYDNHGNIVLEAFYIDGFDLVEIHYVTKNVFIFGVTEDSTYHISFDSRGLLQINSMF